MKKIICLTPVKNEAWVLKYFLETTSLWADYIIIADQNSTDESLEIATLFSKAYVISNKSDNYNELDRQRMLIEYARKKFGNDNILVALDADEILVNFYNNADWDNIQKLEPGTAIYFPWLNVLPGNTTYFNSAGGKNVFAYIDDGREHFGTELHSPRVPLYPDKPSLFIESVKVLHYQFSVRDRQLSKHRWYECLEKIKYPEKDSINLYRMYHHIDVPPKEIFDIPKDWCQLYQDHHIDINNIADDGKHWWDKEVCLLFKQYGVNKFRKQYLWYIDWGKVYKNYFGEESNKSLEDPRSTFDKFMHAWLKLSQTNPNSLNNRAVAKFARLCKW